VGWLLPSRIPAFPHTKRTAVIQALAASMALAQIRLAVRTVHATLLQKYPKRQIAARMEHAALPALAVKL